MTCRNGHRGVEAPSSLLFYCKSMNHAYKGVIKIKYSLGIKGYRQILRTVKAIPAF